MIPHVCQAGKRRDVHADGGEMALWPRRAESRHTQIHDIGLDLAQLIIGQADAFNDINTVVIEHGVGLRNEIVKHALSFRVLQIYRERTFVAVEFEKARRKIRILAGAEKAKRVHTAFAGFDFDNVGAELSQDRGAVRSGEHVIKTHDAHAVQRTVAGSHIQSIVSLPLCVISTPSAILRTGSGRNVRSLTFVRDDNSVSGHCDRVCDGGDIRGERQLSKTGTLPTAGRVPSITNGIAGCSVLPKPTCSTGAMKPRPRTCSSFAKPIGVFTGTQGMPFACRKSVISAIVYLPTKASTAGLSSSAWARR